jgi:hypothetical protein
MLFPITQSEILESADGGKVSAFVLHMESLIDPETRCTKHKAGHSRRVSN